MASKSILTGIKFSRLSVINQNQISTLAGKARWDCICDCGNKVTVIGSSLVSGNTSSCGCLHKEILTENNTIHSMSSIPEYDIWKSIIQRCTNSNNDSYANYGGRGITVCDRWLNSFEAFYEDMGSRPSSDHSIDRRENNGNYEKNNCYWATRIEQNNNKRNNVFYEYRGNNYTIPQLAQLPEAIENKIRKGTLNSRINIYKWSIEDALNRPIK
jgi:hypothetical protein